MVLPKSHPITVVIGNPIPVQKKSSFTDEEVDELHTMYKQALVDLFEEFQPKYGSFIKDGLKIIG